MISEQKELQLKHFLHKDNQKQEETWDVRPGNLTFFLVWLIQGDCNCLTSKGGIQCSHSLVNLLQERARKTNIWYRFSVGWDSFQW